jgi:hypothetical protein
VKAKALGLYPFVPSGRDFKTALDFFAAIGFQRLWENGGYAGLRCGAAYFILQDIAVPDWQANQMIVIEVDDLDAYWSDLDAKGLPGKFQGVKVRPPTDFPWGREVHLIDPAGVCWHVRQAVGAA